MITSPGFPGEIVFEGSDGGDPGIMVSYNP